MVQERGPEIPHAEGSQRPLRPTFGIVRLRAVARRRRQRSARVRCRSAGCAGRRCRYCLTSPPEGSPPRRRPGTTTAARAAGGPPSPPRCRGAAGRPAVSSPPAPPGRSTTTRCCCAHRAGSWDGPAGYVPSRRGSPGTAPAPARRGRRSGTRPRPPGSPRPRPSPAWEAAGAGRP